MLKRIVILVLLVLGFFLAYQGWQWQLKQRHGEPGLLPRVQAYWEAVRLNDHYTKFQMEAPVKLEQVDPSMYNMQRDFNYRVIQYSLGEVSIQGDRASVKVTQSLSLPDMGAESFNANLTDWWSFIDGEWYHGRPLGEKTQNKNIEQNPPTEDPSEPEIKPGN